MLYVLYTCAILGAFRRGVAFYGVEVRSTAYCFTMNIGYLGTPRVAARVQMSCPLNSTWVFKEIYLLITTPSRTEAE